MPAVPIKSGDSAEFPGEFELPPAFEFASSAAFRPVSFAVGAAAFRFAVEFSFPVVSQAANIAQNIKMAQYFRFIK
jgi:hypothetical protein